jgi:hypothetical protein
MIDNDLAHEAEQLALAEATLAAPDEATLHAEPAPATPEPAPVEPAPGALTPAPGDVTPPAPAAPTMSEFLALRDQAAESQRRLAQYEAAQQAARQQQSQQQPDPFMHPDKFADARIQAAIAPVISQLQAVVANNNLAAARAVHGQELADKAYQEFDKALPTMSPFEAAQVMQAPNPFVAAVQWHRRREILQQVGDDPNAYRERLLQEALQDQDFLTRAREVISARMSGRPTQALPPRNEAGQFVAPPPAAKLLPSVNRTGSAQQAMSAQPVALDDLELADEILNMREEPT